MSPEKKKRKRRPPAKKTGRKTQLTKDTLLLIKDGILQGYSHKKICSEINIPYETWRGWLRRNFEGFKEKLMAYDHEYMLMRAENNIKEVLGLETLEPVIGLFGPVIDKKTRKAVIKQNDKLLKIKTDTSTFVAETLGKNRYSRKIESEVTEIQRMVVLDDSQTNEV